MRYTLGQAAKATGKSKSTIQASIKKGRISASQNDFGQYQIDLKTRMARQQFGE